LLITIGLTVGTGKGGGRKEADVVGARIRSSNIEIMHVEIGALYESSGNIVKIELRNLIRAERMLLKIISYNRLVLKGIRLNTINFMF